MVNPVGFTDAAGQRATPEQGHELAREGFRNHRLAEAGAIFHLVISIYARMIGDGSPVDVTQKLCLTGPSLPVGRGGMGP